MFILKLISLILIFDNQTIVKIEITILIRVYHNINLNSFFRFVQHNTIILIFIKWVIQIEEEVNVVEMKQLKK